ncbi:hypothetical protein FRC10_010115 [Ceratobasidium sp. 414]|nr:hypothetical protein FRC10_010115 [Ceratobasidium sp. 414]
MVNPWEPGTQYNLGDQVEYEGIRYKLIQPHRSQSDWTPPVTPALWGREYGVPSTNQPQQDHSSGEQRPWDQHDHTKVEIDHEEKKQNWFDITPERRKQLEIGGGLLAGAALLGGGFLAYKKHKEHEEDKKALAWSLQIPQGALVGGKDSDGTPLYIARTFFEGGIHPGKVSPNFKKGAIIGYDGEEIEVENYEVLLGNEQSVRWVDTSRFSTESLGGARPIEGGREADGTPLYVVRAPYKGGVHPGKTSEKLGNADITYGGDEKRINQFEVLVYA